MLEMRDELFERGFSGYIPKRLSNVWFSNYIFITCFIGVLVVGATDASTAGTRNCKNTVIEIIMTRYLTIYNLFSSINFSTGNWRLGYRWTAIFNSFTRMAKGWRVVIKFTYLPFCISTPARLNSSFISPVSF